MIRFLVLCATVVVLQAGLAGCENPQTNCSLSTEDRAQLTEAVEIAAEALDRTDRTQTTLELALSLVKNKVEDVLE